MSPTNNKTTKFYGLPNAGDVYAPISAVRHPRLGQKLSGIVSVVLVAWLIVVIAVNKNINWSVIWAELFGATIMKGLWVTLTLTLFATLIGITLGILLAIARLGKNPVLKSIASGFIWFFRGTPLLVQLLLWFNLALFFPTLGFGSFAVDTNTVITAYGAALLGLGLNEAAYQSEIMRSGILAVDRGQVEAAGALGLHTGTVMRRIVLPQALRVVIPPMGNNLITMLKMTSLVTVIAAPDLLNRAQAISARNFYVFEMLIVATIWYLILTTVFTVIQQQIEKRVSRGFTAEQPSFRKRIRRVMSNSSDTQLISINEVEAKETLEK